METKHLKKKSFAQALKEEKPLQVVGTVNAYVALMAEQIGYKALYLSGAGIANTCYGIPDIGKITLDQVSLEAKKILSATKLPLLVDVDTGWEIEKTVKKMISLGVAAIHIEDQEPKKLCGHLPGKKLISKEEMTNRIQRACQARKEENLFIIARTDALAVEGEEKTFQRCLSYVEAGADAIFLEAALTLEQYTKCRAFCHQAPILANITEFGKTPLFTIEELKKADVDIALYPLSVTRAMYLSAFKVLTEIKKKGTQKYCIDKMQTREEIYKILGYDPYGKR